MDSLKIFFTARAALVLIIMGVLLAGLVGGVYLTQRQTQLKSKAADQCSANGAQYNAGDIDYALCRSCLGGGAWGAEGSDYGPNTGSGEWCACALKYNTASFAASKGCSVPAPVPQAPAAPAQPAAPGVGGGSTCPTTSLQNISNEDLIAKCTLAEIALLPNGRLETFPMSILVQLPNSRLEQFSLAFLAKFSNERLQQLSLGTLEKLPNERLEQFTIPFLQKFSNDRLITMRSEVLKQFPVERIKTFPCEVQIQLGYTCSAANGDDVAGTCSFKLLDTKTLTPAKDIVSGVQYKLQITMKNAGKSTWITDTYLLKPSTKTITDWDVSPIALKDSLIGKPVVPNESATFEFPVTGPVLKVASQPESRSFSFQMARGVSEFGAACETGPITILPVTETVTSAGTACYILSENLADVSAVTNCSDINAKAKGIIHSYASDPSTTSYKIVDTTVGIKTIYARFISTKGDIADSFNQINFSPAPFVKAIACTQSATGTGTIVALSGSNFGTHTQQGAGGVTVNGTQAQIVTWDPVKGLIQATVPTRLEGVLNIDLKVDDGRSVNGGKCTIGTSSVQFTVNNQCSKPGSFSVDNVDAVIVQNVAGAKPLLSTRIGVSKGVPQNFTPKLESNKNYSLLLKAPRALAKKIDFKTDQGTVNLGQVSVITGDIAPFSAPDGKINSLDTSEMIRQWSLLPTGATTKTADLVGHGVVNSLDYSCLKLGFNKEDDVLTLPEASTTTTTTTTVTTRTVPVRGKVFLDANSNNAYDTGETLISGAVVKALYPAAVQTPAQKLTPEQAAAATVLGTTTTDSNGNYSLSLTAPVGILNLVIWVDPGSATGQGGQEAVGIGAITDTVLQQNPLSMNIGVKP